MAKEDINLLIDDLLLRLKGMEHAEDKNKLHELENQSAILHRNIKVASKRLSITVSLLKETTKLLHVLSSVARAYDVNKGIAESTWVSYWGIAQQCDTAIVEMETLAP